MAKATKSTTSTAKTPTSTKAELKKSREQKAAEKQAEKLLARAEKAVEEARDAVRTSRKKLRNQAQKLSEKTAKLAAKHAASVQELEAATADAAPTPTVETMMVADAPSLTPPLPSPQGPVPTLIELRQRAREQQIAGYSRMTKAALIEALNTTP